VSEKSKQQAIEWAQQILSYGRDLLIFDTETTAAHPKEAELVELGVINGLGEVIYQTFVRPENPIPPEATEVHGITDEMVANAPPCGPVIASFHSMISERIALVAYNYQYDEQVLINSAVGHPEVSGHLNPRLKACAMKVWSYWHGDYDPTRGDYRWVKLTEAAKEAGLDTSTAHRAVDDCRMTLGILWWLSEQSPG
jgi:DNA polymerase-3 subunit epsilon